MTMVKAHVFTHELVAERYQLVDIVHRETNRICWYAKDVGTQRPCLLTQIVLPTDPDGEAGPRAAARVISMSETMGRLCPGRVATVVDAVAEHGVLWTVAEWVDGTPLGELLREGAFDQARAARIAWELLDVLEAAHGQGITHGELSPGQVFVPDRGPVVVAGFGLAGATLSPRLTAPSYASPEQARDERIGPAADLWALGAMLYAMLEGRPPFRDRGRPESTLRAVDRLPLRTPVRSGQLTRTVQGLLRKDSHERITRTTLRQALSPVLTEDTGETAPASAGHRLRAVFTAAAQAAPGWSGRAMTAGTALAVVTVVVAVLAATRQLPGLDSTGTGAAPRPSATATTAATAPQTGPGRRAEGHASTPVPSAAATRPPSASASPPVSPSASASASASASGSTSATALPPGFHRYTAPEGFSVALPDGWTRLRTDRQSGVAYRVTFGAHGDPRTLAVTYSTRVGPDPVAVWRDDVEPELERYPGYRRIGDIRATTYQGRSAADMEWLSKVHGTQVRTFGRGVVLGGGRGFSLRWTTPAADWDDSAARQALATVLWTFRMPSA
ncbi:serine/threonine-protein kinase [Streptomyces sp. NPDC020996]|uniref:serine/threonine protein kinase n=1 Tax=Streptomyces sp. NPDC020996 TaxID=3154791 RepID=UPI0033C7CD2A